MSLCRTGDFPFRFRCGRSGLRKNAENVWLGIGGNIGDVLRRFGHLRYELHRERDIMLVEGSSILRNPPFGYIYQPDFYNAICRIRTRLEPLRLLQRMQRIEKRFRRRRSFRDAPRTLDIDILFYGNRKICRPGLVIPHPRWIYRESVRIPLSEMGFSQGTLSYRIWERYAKRHSGLCAGSKEFYG